MRSTVRLSVFALPFLWFHFVGCSSLKELVQDPPRRVLSSNAQWGEELYHEFGCATCHGMDGSGNTSNPLGGRPRDLRYRSSFIQGTTRKDIAYTLYNGIPGTLMFGISDASEEELLAVADYIIENLWEQEREPQASSSAQEETDNASPTPRSEQKTL